MSFLMQVYRSDPFRDLSLGAQYAVTVIALPVPEQWERFYHSEIFSTRCEIQRSRTDRLGWQIEPLTTMFVFAACAEKNGLDECSQGPTESFWRSFPVMWTRFFMFFGLFADWYPRYTQVTQEGTNITVTFNLAPTHLGITSYFLQCYANGNKIYTEITPVSLAFLI